MKNGLLMFPGAHLITDSHTPDLEIRTIEMNSRSLFEQITNEKSARLHGSWGPQLAE
jgi:hypothetical protein